MMLSQTRYEWMWAVSACREHKCRQLRCRRKYLLSTSIHSLGCSGILICLKSVEVWLLISVDRGQMSRLDILFPWKFFFVLGFWYWTLKTFSIWFSGTTKQLLVGKQRFVKGHALCPWNGILGSISKQGMPPAQEFCGLGLAFGRTSRDRSVGRRGGGSWTEGRVWCVLASQITTPRAAHPEWGPRTSQALGTPPVEADHPHFSRAKQNICPSLLFVFSPPCAFPLIPGGCLIETLN